MEFSVSSHLVYVEIKGDFEVDCICKLEFSKLKSNKFQIKWRLETLTDHKFIKYFDTGNER